MPIAKQKITPCLWFDTEAEEAANFYCAIFENSKIDQISRYVDAGQEIHGKKAGSAPHPRRKRETPRSTACKSTPT